MIINSKIDALNSATLLAKGKASTRTGRGTNTVVVRATRP